MSLALAESQAVKDLKTLTKLQADELSLPLSQRRFLTLPDACAYVSLSERTIYRLIETGKLQPRRPVRGRLLIDRLELEALIGSSTSVPRKSRGAHL